jgi:valyl-tRNA synthetase
VATAFKRLHENGLIYRGVYMVNWAPKLQTAVSDLEVEYSEEQGKLYFFKYPLADSTTEEHLPIATTRPETILGDTAVAVHPDDPRYAAFVGCEVVVPMSGGRRIPVIADSYVDMEFGTGALKITPAHDVNDYAIGKRRNLAFINILNKDATMNDAAGRYSGLDRFECREKLWTDMEASGLTIRTEAYSNRYAEEG